jgi:hypothetical protein
MGELTGEEREGEGERGEGEGGWLLGVLLEAAGAMGVGAARVCHGLGCSVLSTCS